MEQAQKLSEFMKPDSVIAQDFYADGGFYFTNDSDTEFIGKWGGKQYKFPPRSRALMPAAELNATPLEVQQIRKKFARDWAEEQFYKTADYQKLTSVERNPDGTPRLNSIHAANTYSESDLIALIQRCLKPLPIHKAEVTEAPRVAVEDMLSTDDRGVPNTFAVDKDTDLVEERKQLKRRPRI